MKKLKSILYFLTLILFLGSCGKKETIDPPEEDLRISTNPTIGNETVGSLSNSFNLKLIISSKPPKTGVKIDISVKNDLDNSVSFTQSTQTASSSISSIDLQVGNLVPGNLYTATIDVTSLSKQTNKAQLIFKVARK